MIKIIITFALCLLYRLIPYRVPNMTPIFAFGFSFGKSKKFGIIASALFCAASIVAYDAVTASVYFDFTETMVKAVCYGLTGLCAGLVAQKSVSLSYWPTVFRYAGISIIGILVFDGASVCLMTLRNPDSFALIVSGQILYTGYHLLSLAFIPLTPLIERWIIKNPLLEFKMAKA